MTSPGKDPLPRVLVCEDGEEYTERFTRLLGLRFCFERAQSLAQAQAALGAGPVAALVLDLDFRRTPPAELVDEAGRACRSPADAPRLAAAQGVLLLRALRRQGVGLPALLCADLDDPEQERRVCAELPPLQVVPSSEGLQALAARLAGAVAGRT